MQAAELDREAASISVPEEALIAELQSWQQLRSQTSSELRAMAMQPQFCVPFLQLGRLVFISDPTHSSAADRYSPSAYLLTHTPRQHSACGMAVWFQRAAAPFRMGGHSQSGARHGGGHSLSAAAGDRGPGGVAGPCR